MRSEGGLSPIKLTSYKEVATCSSPDKFEDLTQPEDLKSLGITSDHVKKILLNHGQKLKKLKLLRVDSEPIPGLQPL